MSSTRGRLLLASPLLEDPNFHRSVVLMVEHADAGALGVVLNRPREIRVDEVLSDSTWPQHASVPPVFFEGGPVESKAVLALGRRLGDDQPDGFTPVVDDIGVVDLSNEDAAVAGITDVRFFLGYAGWSPSQLDEELAADGWFVLDASTEDLTTAAPQDLWTAILQRQPDPELRRYRLFPPDVSVN